MHACTHKSWFVGGGQRTTCGNLFSPSNMCVLGISRSQSWWQTPLPADPYLWSRNNFKWHNVNTLLGPIEGTRRCPGKSRARTTRFLLLHSTSLPVLELHELLLTPQWFLKEWGHNGWERACARHTSLWSHGWALSVHTQEDFVFPPPFFLVFLCERNCPYSFSFSLWEALILLRDYTLSLLS